MEKINAKALAMFLARERELAKLVSDYEPKNCTPWKDLYEKYYKAREDTDAFIDSLTK